MFKADSGDKETKGYGLKWHVCIKLTNCRLPWLALTVSQGRELSGQWSFGKSMDIFLANRRWRAQATVCCTISGKVVLHCMRSRPIKSQRERPSKQYTSMVSASFPTLSWSLDQLWTNPCNLKYSSPRIVKFLKFFPKLFLTLVFITAAKQNRTSSLATLWR